MLIIADQDTRTLQEPWVPQTQVNDQYTIRRYLTNIRKDIFDEENRINALNQMLAGFSLFGCEGGSWRASTGDELLTGDATFPSDHGPKNDSEDESEVDLVRDARPTPRSPTKESKPENLADLESNLQEIVDYDEGKL